MMQTSGAIFPPNVCEKHILATHHFSIHFIFPGEIILAG